MAEISLNWEQNIEHVELSIAAHHMLFEASQHLWNTPSQRVARAYIIPGAEQSEPHPTLLDFQYHSDCNGLSEMGRGIT